MKRIYNILFFLCLLLTLTSCPKEPMFYVLIVNNKTNNEKLKMFIDQDKPGDSLLPASENDFRSNILGFTHDNTAVSFRVCIHEIRGIRDCIESQPEKKIYLFVFDTDTLAAYNYSEIRAKKKYRDRVEIPSTMATNDANLVIDYP